MLNAAAMGLRLARLRREAGLTQAALAKRMRTSQPAISKIESGQNLPTVLWLDRFARATGKPFEITFGASERSPSRSDLRKRVRRVLGDGPFDPWERSPTPAEVKSLESDGLTREQFERKKSSRARRGGKS